MKIRLIRHAKVKINWPKTCNAAEFEHICRQYDQAEIIGVDRMEPERAGGKLYVSPMLRSIETAKLLFPGREAAQLDVGEVPIRAFRDGTLRLPTWVWYVGGRMQWFFGNHRQKETRAETVRRCEAVIDRLAELGEDCVIVTHGFFMKTFLRCLKKKGFTVGSRPFSVSNLQEITAEKEGN